MRKLIKHNSKKFRTSVLNAIKMYTTKKGNLARNSARKWANRWIEALNRRNNTDNVPNSNSYWTSEEKYRQDEVLGKDQKSVREMNTCKEPQMRKGKRP